ncbi:hypothetical protein ACFX1S_046253 [Malus domestica]
MQVKEMHLLCCITLESAGLGDQSSKISLSRSRRLPTSLAAAQVRSDANTAGQASEFEATVSGVLHKWTNYSKRWISRWFLLRNGVLSYSKIRRPETLNLLTPNDDDVRLIDEISTHHLFQMDSEIESRRTVGIVHLRSHPSEKASPRKQQTPKNGWNRPP